MRRHTIGIITQLRGQALKRLSHTSMHLHRSDRLNELKKRKICFLDFPVAGFVGMVHCEWHRGIRYEHSVGASPLTESQDLGYGP